MILFLISSDFMASKYIQTIEVPIAMERHDSDGCEVIPAILRKTVWDIPPYGNSRLYQLPPLLLQNGPIEMWLLRAWLWGFEQLCKEFTNEVEQLKAILKFVFAESYPSAAKNASARSSSSAIRSGPMSLLCK
jgi:hypothetical protein